MKKTKRVKKVFIKNNRLLRRFFVSGLLLVFLILGFVFIANANSISNRKQVNTSKIKTNLASIPHSNVSLKRFSRITYKKIVMPNSIPAPTSVPLTGFCLRVPVLVYHHIQPQADAVSKKQTSLNVDNGIFDQQMSYLASKGYTSIWAIDLVNALKNHTGLPGKPVMVTMDDGYADNDVYALSVLKKYNIKANLMLATGLVGSNPDMLTWSQVQDMKNSGLYYFTNHTWSHYAITNGPQSKIDSEIDTAATQIKQYTGQDVNTFTYPYGSINNNAIQTLQRKGYVGAFSTIPGQYQCDSFIMTIHRTHVGNAPLSAYGL